VALRRLAIVGTGLIGASVGLAAKRAGVEHVSGYDADPDALAVAAERGAVDLAAGSLVAAVEEAELAIVATPVARLAEDVGAVLEAGAGVTELGGTCTDSRPEAAGSGAPLWPDASAAASAAIAASAIVFLMTFGQV